MDVVALAAALSIMGSIIAAMMGLHQATANPRDRLQRRLGTLLGEAGSNEVPVADHGALRPTTTGRTPIVSRFLQGRTWTASLAERLIQADIKLTVSEFVSLRVLFTLVGAAIPAVILGPKLLGILAMAGAAFVGWK